MDKTLAGLIGAIGAVAAAGQANAATSVHADLRSALHAGSYADLLKPVPNAAALREALLASRAAEPEASDAPEATLVQDHHHHHHHHHHRHRRWRPRPHHHHHHHHHHNNGVVIIP